MVTFYGMISDISVTGLLLQTGFWTFYHVFLHRVDYRLVIVHTTAS